jgi:hypothetical protein
VCFFICSDLGKAEKELNAWIGRHFRRRHCPVVTSLLRLHKERTLPILSPDRVSMSALDYSKWDNLEDSDDEDQDGRGGAADEVGNSLLVLDSVPHTPRPPLTDHQICRLRFLKI